VDLLPITGQGVFFLNPMRAWDHACPSVTLVNLVEPPVDQRYRAFEPFVGIGRVLVLIVVD